MHFTIPRDVRQIIDRLRSGGYEAYAVGGCVRDTLLGRVPNDWDITTSALPMQVKALFKRTVDTGLKHGTVTVMLNGTGYEVTTYRIDGEYNDCRHPDSVTFTSKLSEDLRRRDFTINAFVYNDEEGVIDLFGGLDDLKNGIIRCVGVPNERFTEDALRILRAIRFAAQLSFKIEPDTADAARLLAPNLVKVSAERIHVELEKLLLSPNPDYIVKLKELNLAPYIFPELEECSFEKLNSLASALKFSSDSKFVRWALLADAVSASKGNAAETAEKIMRRLKSDNFTTDYIVKFVNLRDYDLNNASDYALRKLLNLLGPKDFTLYINFRKALLYQDTGNRYSNTGTDIVSSSEYLDEIASRLAGIIERNECTEAKQLKINGRILIANGFSQGKGLGFIIEALLDRVLADQSLNDTDTLLAIARELAPTDTIHSLPGTHS